MRLRFSFSPIPFLATLALVALGIVLGNWQGRRAEEKTALQARLAARAAAPPLHLDSGQVDPAGIEFRRVVLRGSFVDGWPVYLDNRPHKGLSGVVLLMPFKIAHADAHSPRYVLVARGWLPRDPAARERLPALPAPAGETTIEGIAVLHPARVMQLGAAAPLTPRAIVQNLEPDAFARASGLPVLPLLVEQTGQAPDGLVRDWPAPAADVARHKGYAFQWYALAAMAFVFYVMTGFRRGSKQAR